MAKYLAKWASAGGKYLEFDPIMTVEFSFFDDLAGYTAQDRAKIAALDIGGVLDLSDGLGNYHEIERA